MHRRGLLAAGLGTWLARPALAQGQWAPTRPMRMIVPWPPAGTTDIVARMLAQPISEALGQPVVVENRGGASGLIGTEAIVRAEPDGHTFGWIISTHAANAHLVRQQPFDAIRDITPIVHVVDVADILCVGMQVPANSMQQLMELGRRTGSLSYASSGNGTSTHMAGELFKLSTGINMVHVPYRGGGPALTDLIAGNVTSMFCNATSSLPHIRGGRLRPLAVTTAERVSYLPETPTVKEAGVPNVEIVEWYGMVGPRGMPAAAVQRINDVVNRIITAEAMKTRLLESGSVVMAGPPERFANLIAGDVAKYGDVIRRAGITAE